MAKGGKPKIGEYRHTPGTYLAGADGKPRAARTRRRFPYLAMVFLGSAVAGPLACAAVALLFSQTPLRVAAPQPYGGARLPPSPTLQNVLFGAGVHEVALASALAGWCLWTWLWKTKLPPAEMEKGGRTVLWSLVRLGLLLGPVCTLGIGLPAGAMGLFLRTGPAEIPWIARPFFGLIAMLPIVINSLFTGTIPVVLIALGMLLGAVMGCGVAEGWRHFPEEPDTR